MDQESPNGQDSLDTQRLFEALYQHMSEGVALHRLLCDASGKPIDYRILGVNPQFKAFTGLSPEQVVGNLATEVYGTAQAPYLSEYASVALEGKPLRLQTYFEPLDRHYEISVAPLGPGLFATIFMDVSDRLRFEHSLRENEEKFRRTFELIPNPVTLSTLDGVLRECNGAFCEAVGYPREELLGRRSTELGLWSDAEQRKAMMAGLQKDGRVDSMEVSMRSRTGQIRLMHFSARILLLGSEPTMVAVAQDITEHRNLERQILHSQKLESLGVLAGGIAHDFNNLLTGILGNADLARVEMSPMAPARRSLEGIEKAARRAADLCRQLLAYSGKGRFLVQPVDLQDLVDEMGHLLSVSISKKVVLKYHFAQGLPLVDADATQVRQVVMNLIVNASEAIGDRSGVISLTTGLAHCDEHYLKACYTSEGIQPGDFVYLEVADTGHGMDKATLDRIFDPFFTTKFTGRGLGLAAVLGIMRGHKGAIKVYSEIKRGTTFKLLFPPGEASVCKPEDKNGGKQTWKGQGTILVVDDEETVRTLARRALEYAGFRVLVAEDGRDALTQFRHAGSAVALVILDLTMPHLDGEACFRELRQLDPCVNVILSSGYNEQDVVNRFAGKGLAGFIQKPYTSNDLITKVREVLGGEGAGRL